MKTRYSLISVLPTGFCLLVLMHKCTCFFPPAPIKSVYYFSTNAAHQDYTSSPISVNLQTDADQIYYAEKHRRLSTTLFAENVQVQQISKSTTPINTNDLYDEPLIKNATIWQLYLDCMQQVANNQRVIQKTKPGVVKSVQDFLFLNRKIVADDDLPSLSSNNDTDFRKGLHEHRRNFAQAVVKSTIGSINSQDDDDVKINNAKSEQQNDSWTKDHFEYCTRCLAYVGDKSAKACQSEAVQVAWLKLRETGIIPRERLVSTYLYVLGEYVALDTLDDNDWCAQVAAFHDLLYEPNEKTVYLRVKHYIAKNEISVAENLLESLTSSSSSSVSSKVAAADCQRLRTFVPLLQYYSSQNDTTCLLRLFRAMRESSGVYIDANTYALVVGTLARLGVFSVINNNNQHYHESKTTTTTTTVPMATSFGFTVNSGPVLLDEILSEMAEDLLELTPEAASALDSAFVEGFCGSNTTATYTSTDDISSNTFNTNTTVDHMVPDCRLLGTEALVGRVIVDKKSATCPVTGSKLRLIALTESQRQSVHDNLLEMAAVQFEEFNEKLRNRSDQHVGRGDSARARNQLAAFSTWLADRDGEPFTAIIDGANVAYAGHGDVHYSQVQLVVNELERLGEHPLVIMPSKYMAKSFHIASLQGLQYLTKADEEVRDNLLTKGQLYSVPSSCLDDYYWMLASVAKQKNLKHTTQLLDDADRLPGLRPLLITNDQMRDHKLALLEPRLFRRWASSHIVNYYLKPYNLSEWENREVQLFPADFFSHEIQVNPAKHERYGNSWHLPITDWADNYRFCINIFEKS